MCLHSLQTGIADRQAGRFLGGSGSALSTGRRRSSRRASSPPPHGGVGFSAESYQHALGDFQLIELIPELNPFGIEPRKPFGNPLLLLSNLVHRSHLLDPSSSLDAEDDVIGPVFSMEKYASCPDDDHSEQLSMSAGIADKPAPPEGGPFAQRWICPSMISIGWCPLRLKELYPTKRESRKRIEFTCLNHGRRR